MPGILMLNGNSFLLTKNIGNTTRRIETPKIPIVNAFVTRLLHRFKTTLVSFRQRNF